MKINKNKKIINTIFVLFVLFSTNLLAAQNDFFIKGKNLFEKKDFDKSKVFFERDLVFNPKSEKSYLYLAKIFIQEENDDLQEQNLKTVLLLNPTNEEALYLLTLLKIKKSDYNESNRLLKNFLKICKVLCEKETELSKKFNSLQTQ